MVMDMPLDLVADPDPRHHRLLDDDLPLGAGEHAAAYG
jgi:hypothetical protein